MFTRISDRLIAISTGRVTLTGLIIFLLFGALVLPRQAAIAEQTSGGAGSPDTSYFYSASDLYDMAEAYGEAGRAAYVRSRFTFDAIFPLVYTLFLVTSVSWVYGRAFLPGSVWRLANLIPILAMLFDFLENCSASLVMWRYPDPTPIIVHLAPLFTALKWLFVSGSFVALLAGLVVLLVKRLRAR
ncbi:MAG: hypothetical protein J5I90_08720 [Caldilineales bacterium]|nr:hypothetical protein [Caldilineales bacterium]